MSVGTAIHAGVAVYLRGVGGLPALSSPALPDPVSESQRVLEGLYEPQETWGLDGLQALVKKGVQELIRLLEDNILPGAEVVAVEYADPFQDQRLGLKRTYRIVDCILARGTGADRSLEVWDWKTKLRLDAAYLEETSRAVLHSWQLLDYSWHVGQWARTGALVCPAKVCHAAHGLVILGPKLVAHAIPISITPERLAQWHTQAKIVWSQMWAAQQGLYHCEETRQRCVLYMNWEACTDRHLHFGKECPFMPACHQLNGNEERFSGVYQMREGV